jgi:hypothetical protein
MTSNKLLGHDWWTDSVDKLECSKFSQNIVEASSEFVEVPSIEILVEFLV